MRICKLKLPVLQYHPLKTSGFQELVSVAIKRLDAKIRSKLYLGIYKVLQQLQ